MSNTLKHCHPYNGKFPLSSNCQTHSFTRRHEVTLISLKPFNNRSWKWVSVDIERTEDSKNAYPLRVVKPKQKYVRCNSRKHEGPEIKASDSFCLLQRWLLKSQTDEIFVRKWAQCWTTFSSPLPEFCPSQNPLKVLQWNWSPGKYNF